MVEDRNRADALLMVRKLELEAYGAVVTALRTHGDLADRGKTLLEELRTVFKISEERHKAEIRRAANDDNLASIAERAMGSLTCENWLSEGKRVAPPLPKVDPQTAFTRLANSASKKQVEIEMAKFVKTKELLEKAIQKHEESASALALENDSLDTKRRLSDLTPLSPHEFPQSNCDEEQFPKTTITANNRKRVRVWSPQQSPVVEGDHDNETTIHVKSKKLKDIKEQFGKKQKLRMSPPGNSSVQENLPAEEANSTLRPGSHTLISPVKGTTIDQVSPLATPSQLVLFASQSDQTHGVVGDVSADKIRRSPPKSPKQQKEKKMKQSKKSQKLSASTLKSDLAENQSILVYSSSLSSPPPVTISGVSASRPIHHSAIMQQQAAAVTAAAAAQNAQQSSHPSPHYQQQQGSVVLSSSGQSTVSASIVSQGNLVQASPGKVAQSSYHNYAPPLAPLSINPMRLVGRAGTGVAISTAASSPPSITVNNFRPPDTSNGNNGNVPVLRLTPQGNAVVHSQRPGSTSTRSAAFLTPAAPGVPGVLTLRSHRPTLTPVTSGSHTTGGVRPSIVIHQTGPGGQQHVVMRRIGSASATTIPASAVSSTPITHTSTSSRPLIISSTSGGSSGSSVLVINKNQHHHQSTPPQRPHVPSVQTSQPHQLQIPNVPQSVAVSHSSLISRKAPPLTYSHSVSQYQTQIGSKQTNEHRFNELSSPPAVGAESTVETCQEMFGNGTSESNFVSSSSSIPIETNGGGLVLLQQAVEAVSTSTLEQNSSDVSYTADKDLANRHESTRFENVSSEVNYRPASSGSTGLTGVVSQNNPDAELFNEDLMMAIMNPGSANSQNHQQSQPS